MTNKRVYGGRQRALGGNPAICSGVKAASALIHTGRTALASIIIITDGTNDAVVTVYDNVAGSGKIVRKFTVTGDENFGGNVIKFPVLMETGIYVTVSGTGAEFIIDYIDKAIGL